MRKGELTRAAILDVALDLASRDGLEGLTIGLLADKMNMSKSGVFAHFGSREDLQLEVLKLYHHRFEQEVFFPSVKEPRGIQRLQAMFARWVKRVSVEIALGCIYISGAVEYDDPDDGADGEGGAGAKSALGDAAGCGGAGLGADWHAPGDQTHSGFESLPEQSPCLQDLRYLRTKILLG